MIDLSVEYSGLKLKNPIVVSSSPLGENIETIRELEKKRGCGNCLAFFI